MWTIFEFLFDGFSLFDWFHRSQSTRLGESELDRKSRRFTAYIFAGLGLIALLGGALYWYLTR